MLYIDRNIAVYLDSFGIEYISQEALHKITDKTITHNVFRIQHNVWILLYRFHKVGYKNFVRLY